MKITINPFNKTLAPVPAMIIADTVEPVEVDGIPADFTGDLILQLSRCGTVLAENTLARQPDGTATGSLNTQTAQIIGLFLNGVFCPQPSTADRQPSTDSIPVLVTIGRAERLAGRATVALMKNPLSQNAVGIVNPDKVIADHNADEAAHPAILAAIEGIALTPGPQGEKGDKGDKGDPGTGGVILAPSTKAPVMDASPATIGTSTDYARADHRHPTDYTRAPLNSPNFTGEVRVDYNRVMFASSDYYAQICNIMDSEDPAFIGHHHQYAYPAASRRNPLAIHCLASMDQAKIDDYGGWQRLTGASLFEILHPSIPVEVFVNFTDENWEPLPTRILWKNGQPPSLTPGWWRITYTLFKLPDPAIPDDPALFLLEADGPYS